MDVSDVSDVNAGALMTSWPYRGTPLFFALAYDSNVFADPGRSRRGCQWQSHDSFHSMWSALPGAREGA